MRPRERRCDADGEEDDEAGRSCSTTDPNTSTSSSTGASSGARRNGGGAAAGSSPVSGATINLSQEYTLAIQTSSYNEIWAKIHVTVDGQRVDGGAGDEDEEDRCTLASVLLP